MTLPLGYCLSRVTSSNRWSSSAGIWPRRGTVARKSAISIGPIILKGFDVNDLRISSHENRHSSRVRDRHGHLRVWQYFRDALDPSGDTYGHLLELPPVLYGQAEAGRYGRPCRAVPSEIREENHLSLRDRLTDALVRADEVGRLLLDPKTMRDPRALARLGRERQRLEQVVELAAQLYRLDEQLAPARELFDVDDPEMAAEARDEVARLTEGIGRIEAALKPLLIPHDPLDDRPAIVEIRAGTGGDEAALFAADLHRMYTRYAERLGWKIDHLSYSDGSLGGLKEVIMKVDGPGAYGALRYESGVHRVQR